MPVIQSPESPVVQRGYGEILRAVWAAGVAAVIVGSLLPAGSAPMRALAAAQVNDKALHFLAYALLALLPALHEKRRPLVVMAITLLVLGVLLEFGQLLSPGRSFELADMLADACGVLCGLLLGWPPRILLRRCLPEASSGSARASSGGAG